jgi:sensor histidine kinase regulating citrate/malate metabolism
VREVVVTSVGYPDAIEIEVADSGPSAIAENYFLKPAGPLALADVHGLESRVWQLVVQLGGTLTAINCPEGGTAFTLRLPHRLRQRMAA